MSKKGPTPTILNKKARSILRANHVDSQYVCVVSSPKSITLYGVLIRSDGEDFTHQAVEKLLMDLTNLGRVSSQLENWCLNSGVKQLANLDD